MLELKVIKSLDPVVLGQSLCHEQKAELLFFKVAGIRLAMSVFDIREVLSTVDYLQLPQLDQPGKILLRGEEIPLWDVRKWLTIELPEIQMTTADEPVLCILVDFQTKTHALWIHDLAGCQALEWSALHAAREAKNKGLFFGPVGSPLEEVGHMLHWDNAIWGRGQSNQDAVEGLHEITNMPLKAASVWFVDDSKIAKNLLTHNAQELGIHSQCFSEAEAMWSALEILSVKESEQFKALKMIMIDTDMLGLDGYQLVHKIKTNTRLSHLKVWLHQSIAQEPNLMMAEAVGADGSIPIFNTTYIKEALQWLC